MIDPIASKEVVKERRAICNGCPQLRYAWGLKIPFISTLKTCGVCKCSVHVKTTLTYANCPLNKW
jgi:hypothetical protein